ncbi:MAG: OprO/OprP family phosphate-selective porin [Burkholderiales bacterium]
MQTEKGGPAKLRALMIAALSGSALAVASIPAGATTADELLKVLRDKGVLTQDEYEVLAEERDLEKSNEQAARKDTLQAKFKDGVVFESDDKSTSISVNGRIQLDYRDFTSPENSTADTFDMRRVRLGVKGKFFNDYSFDVTGEYSGVTGNSVIDVAYFDVAWWEAAKFRFGQFKQPMSLEEQTSSRFIDFQERSFVNSANFTPGKEQGVMLFGTPTKGVNYGLALSTGEGQNVDDTDNNDDNNDIIGRLSVNFAEVMDDKNAVYHFGGSFSDGELTNVLDPASQRTEGRGITFFNPTAFNARDDVERMRYAFETALAWGPFKFQGEYATAEFEGTSVGGVDFERDMDAYYVSALWLISGERYADSYKGGKFERIIPKSNFVHPSAGLGGAWEIGVRYSDFDASDFQPTNPAGTGVLTTAFSNKADAWTVGLKWIVNPYTRFMLNYVRTDFDTPVTLAGDTFNDEDAITFRGQFDF